MIYAIIFLPMVMVFAAWYGERKSIHVRNLIAAVTTLIELLLVIVLAMQPKGTWTIEGIAGLGLSFETDGFRNIYLIVIAFLWLMTTLFGEEYFSHYKNCNRYYFFNLMTLGATMGVFLAADLFTALIFFEIMSFTSYTWVIEEETEDAISAANTYLAVAVIGGLAVLMGLFLCWHYLGTTRISELYAAAQQVENKRMLYVAGGCVLFGFGAKAGMFPMHIWLPKAHPVAPAPASALLSGLLTKTGIFGVIVLSCRMFYADAVWGNVILWFGAITMLLGAVLALFSIDLKRTLACSSVSQIGFILVGIGMMGLLGEENSLAAAGTLLHMINHSLFKLILFLSAGAVYMNLHELNLNSIRGFGRKKPLLMIPFLTAALGIGGFPFLNGYVSKTLLHESVVEGIAVWEKTGLSSDGLHAVEWIFLFSGGLTVAYMTKLFVAVFIEKHPVRQKEFDGMSPGMNRLSALVLNSTALILPVLGMMPNRLMIRIANYGTDFFLAESIGHLVQFFSWESLQGGLISIGIGFIVYFAFVRTALMRKTGTEKEYIDAWPKWLDLENGLYRPFLFIWLSGILGYFAELFGNNRITGYLANGFFSGSYRVVQAASDGVKSLGKAVMRAASIISHGVSDSLDALVVVFRKTLYRDIAPKSKDREFSSFFYQIGAFLDRVTERHGKKREDGRRYSDLIYRGVHTAFSTSRMLTGGLSFALLMLVLGITFVFVYVLFLR